MSEDRKQAPRIVGVGAVFIDDIILPSGQTYMGQLGGGVVHALTGAAVWGERPGISALVGQGLPDSALERLEQAFDTSGLIQLDIPQIRAWQLFEEDGTRREVYRVAETAPFIIGAKPEHLPQHYQESQGFYLLQDFDGVRAWCEAIHGVIVWEPLQQVMTPGNRAAIRSTLHDCGITVISPNLAEAQAVYGELPPEDILNLLFDDGAQAVALRMGENGSIVAEGETGERWYVPAVPVQRVVDQTGAGNTYCGGLLWGLIEGKNIQEAGAIGAASASFCVEGVGMIDVTQINPSERERRYRACLAATSKSENRG